MADTEKMCLVVHRRCAFVNPWLGWGIDLHSYRSILQTFSVTPDSLSIPWSGWQLLISSPPTWNHTCVSLLHRWLEERRKWSCSVVSVCDPMGRSLPGSSVRGIFLLQGIFPTQGSNPGLLRCRQTLCRLSHQGSPPMTSSTHQFLPLTGNI